MKFAVNLPWKFLYSGCLKNVYAFRGLWNENFVADIQNMNVNLSVKV